MPTFLAGTLALGALLVWSLSWAQSYRWPLGPEQKFVVVANAVAIVAAVALKNSGESIRFSATTYPICGAFVYAASIPWSSPGGVLGGLHGVSTGLALAGFLHMGLLRFAATPKLGVPIIGAAVAALVVAMLVGGTRLVWPALAGVVVVVWLGLAGSVSTFGVVTAIYVVCIVASILDSTGTVIDLRRLGAIPSDAVDEGMVDLHRGLIARVPAMGVVQLFAVITLLRRSTNRRRQVLEMIGHGLLALGLCLLVLRTQ